MNTCPNYKAIRDDNFVFLATDSPLVGFPMQPLRRQNTAYLAFISGNEMRAEAMTKKILGLDKFY